MILRVRSSLPFILALSLLLAACGGETTNPATTTAPATRAATTAQTASGAPSGTFTVATGTLSIFAAASLAETFNEIAGIFEKANPGVKVVFNYAGSPALVTQLTQGAKADLFASADQPNMDTAVNGGIITGTPRTFAKNKLVIIVPKDNRAGITTPKDLAKPGIKFDTAQASVPISTYTQTVLDNFPKVSEYGVDFKALVNKNIVSQEDNVKAIVQKVQLGEVDAGIVYATDAQAVAEELTLIPIPDAQNVIATYPIALVKDSKQAATGQNFLDYLLSADGQAILKKYGFAPAT